jgi:transposase
MSRIAVGWDLHRKFSQVAIIEQPDTTNPAELCLKECLRIDHHDRDAMRQWLAQLPPGTPVAMEGAFGWPWVADLLAEAGLEPHLGHPPALKVLAAHEAKGDRKDAQRLGRFWLKGTFPECYLSTPEVRQIRERIRYRMALAHLRTELKNRVQALLHRHGAIHPFTDLFGQRGRAYLKQLVLPEASRFVLDSWLELFDFVAKQLAEVEAWMTEALARDPVIKILTSTPGIGLILAHVIHAEVGEISRFADRRRFVAYAGLAPLADDSAERHGRRHISPQCNHVLRWAFIEAASVIVRAKTCPAKIRLLSERIRGRGGCQQARVAVAREVAELVFTLWSRGELYNQATADRPLRQRPAATMKPKNSSTVRPQETRHPIVPGPSAAETAL